MRTRKIKIDGTGNSCARSCKVALAAEKNSDPEIEFEVELLKALRETESEANAEVPVVSDASTTLAPLS